MEWTDDGIVLGTRRHGEANAILEVMTPAHGRHLGLVRGGAGSRLRPVLQPGNSVRVVWRGGPPGDPRKIFVGSLGPRCRPPPFASPPVSRGTRLGPPRPPLRP